MKTFYKLVCEKCYNIIEKSKKQVEHSTITTEGKSCQLCNSKKIKLWRSCDYAQNKRV